LFRNDEHSNSDGDEEESESEEERHHVSRSQDRVGGVHLLLHERATWKQQKTRNVENDSPN
jgi:hypothetical protein